MNIIEITKANHEEIFIGGMSMGGCLSLHLLRKDLPPQVKGIFTIGSFLVRDSVVLKGPLGSASKLPIFMMHGTLSGNLHVQYYLSSLSSIIYKGG
jgi:predicted esterase